MLEKHCRTDQATDGNMKQRIACWIPKATNTHTVYVILIAFPMQKWLHGLTSMLRYMYITCPVNVDYLYSNFFRDRLGLRGKNDSLSHLFELRFSDVIDQKLLHFVISLVLYYDSLNLKMEIF
jgi:hypothetical protein